MRFIFTRLRKIKVCLIFSDAICFNNTWYFEIPLFHDFYVSDNELINATSLGRLNVS